MKNLILILVMLGLAGCNNGPKYKYGQLVQFKLPPFYDLNCLDWGRITKFEVRTDGFFERYVYQIADVECHPKPGYVYTRDRDFEVNEEDIRGPVTQIGDTVVPPNNFNEPK